MGVIMDHNASQEEYNSEKDIGGQGNDNEDNHINSAIPSRSMNHHGKDNNPGIEHSVAIINDQNRIDHDNHQNKETTISDELWSVTGSVLRFFQDKYNLAFIVVLLLGVSIRLKYFHIESIWNDAAVHLWRAIQVTREPISTFFTQEYLIGDYQIPQTITAIIYLVVGDVFVAGKIMALNYVVAGIVLIYVLGIELKDKLTGVIAALLFGMNHVFWFYSIRPLGDGPLMVSFMFLIFCLVRLEKKKTLFWGVLTGFAFFVAMFHKTQAAIFVIGVIIYYLIFRTKEMFTNKAFLVSWLIPVSVMVTGDFIARMLYHRLLLGRIWNLFIGFAGMPYGLEASERLFGMISYYLLPFVLFGILLVYLHRSKTYYPLVGLFFFYWIFFEINIDNTQDRYLLPILPLAVLFSTFAIVELGHYASMFIHKKSKYFVIGAIVFVVVFSTYQTGSYLIEFKKLDFTGHPEAGAILKATVPEGTPIFSGAPRMTRLFVERKYGGPHDWDQGGGEGGIWNLRDPIVYANNKSAFEEDVKRLNKNHDIFLVFDVWEGSQPDWYFPIQPESHAYFESLGFKIVTAITKPARTNKGNILDLPVIFIYKKEKINFEKISTVELPPEKHV